jgi:hypothetical protein
MDPWARTLSQTVCVPVVDPTCPGSGRPLDPTTDPNDVRLKPVLTAPPHFSSYEIDPRPDNKYRYFVMGQRNPVPWDVSQPFLRRSGAGDTVDYLASCQAARYRGYNRNARWTGSLFDPKPF